MTETNEAEEKLGIIRDVKFGVRDVGWPTLTFWVDMIGYSFGVSFNNQDALDFVRTYQIADITDLEGAPCVVEEGNPSTFVRLFTKI